MASASQDKSALGLGPKERICPKTGRVIKTRNRKPKDRLDAKSADFANKPPITTNEAIAWVRDNMALSDLTPKDAPSPFAWQLYLDVRSDPSFKKDVFYSKLLIKTIPTQAAIDKSSVQDAQTRKVTVTIANRIAAMRDEAIAEANVSVPQGAVQ